MKYLITIVALLLSIMSFAQSDDELNAADFKKMMDSDKSVVVLDVRTPDEIRGGVIGKPLKVDYFAKDFDEKIKALDKSATYLVYCASGVRSGETVELMKRLGFKKAYNLAGGFDNWKRNKFPIDQ